MTNTLQQAGQAGVRGRILAENEARPVPGRLGLAALATPPRASAGACPNRFEREGPNSTLTSRSIRTSLTNPGFIQSWRSGRACGAGGRTRSRELLEEPTPTD